MAASFAPFPSIVHPKMFRTEDDDLCVFLRERWRPLLADLGRLGPVALISRNEQMSLVSFHEALRFLPVPGSTEMLDVASGTLLETNELGVAIAGKEARSGNLSLAFFDLTGDVLFKVLLAPGADEEAFAQIVEDYARVPVTRPTQPRRFTRLKSREGAVLADERRHFQSAWRHFDPRLGGDFLPGGHGVSWWDALCLAGGRRASFLTKVGLIKAILGAHQDRSPLRLTTWNGGFEHSVTVTPLRLERCTECLHLLGPSGEGHFFLEAEMNFWTGFHGTDARPAIHIFLPGGQRRGLIEFEGPIPEFAR